MASSPTLTPLFTACSDIANQVADNEGFVAIRSLLERFRTHLRMRPLLVEGMIGSLRSNDEKHPEWIVLVDSERYPNIEAAISEESASNPLAARFRFTVAHELAHSLAFRMSEFGVKLEGVSDRSENKSLLVEQIEREADQLAPLLLCADQDLTSRLQRLTEPIDIDFVVNLRRSYGISREVLLNRLALSRSLDRSGLWQRPHLREFGLVIGEYKSQTEVIFRRWPLFHNFSRLVPKGILTIAGQDKVPFEIAFEAARGALRTNGPPFLLTTPAGTVSAPDAEQMLIEISAEQIGRNKGAPFFTLIRNQKIHAEVREFERIRGSKAVRNPT